VKSTGHPVMFLLPPDMRSKVRSEWQKIKQDKVVGAFRQPAAPYVIDIPDQLCSMKLREG